MSRRIRRLAVLYVAAVGVAVASAVTATAAPGEGFTGTCVQAPSLPCSASAGQSYGGVALDASGNDDEQSVEAVLGEVVGPAADVTALARGVTGDSGDFDVTPNTVTGGQVFEWSYRGEAQNLAYLTVKASNGFAIYGIAGERSGSVDIAELLGGHDISHVSFWATNVSQTEPVVAKALHGKGFLGNTRLAKIDNGTVPCLHVDTLAPARCAFTRKSGSWLESKKGQFAKANQAITLDGKPGGDYVVAAKMGLDGAVPCLAPSGRDSAGTVYGTELAGACVIETANSPYNATGKLLENDATREVCTSTYPHPDGATLTRTYPTTRSDGTPTTAYCYTGRGAALNDSNGTERDDNDVYLTGPEFCHVLINGYGNEVAAAKRPNTRSWPTMSVNVTTPIVWRAVNEAIAIAN